MNSILTHNPFVIWSFSAREKGTYMDKRGRRAGAVGKALYPGESAMPRPHGKEGKPGLSVSVTDAHPFVFKQSAKTDIGRPQLVSKK